jgi:hypothetical protein
MQLAAHPIPSSPAYGAPLVTVASHLHKPITPNPAAFLQPATVGRPPLSSTQPSRVCAALPVLTWHTPLKERPARPAALISACRPFPARSPVCAQDQQRIGGALYVLRLLARKYEFRDEEDRAPLEAVVNTTFPLLLPIFKVRPLAAWSLLAPSARWHILLPLALLPAPSLSP